MQPKIKILGGGIIGTTTAILLKCQGFDVEIISKSFLWENIDDPTLASLYPAASVLPHGVNGNINALFKKSLEYFSILNEKIPNIIRKQSHLRIYEGEFQPSDYYKEIANIEYINNQKWRNITIPHRGKVSGLGYDILFVEMPEYAQWIFQTIQALEIPYSSQEITEALIHEMNDEQTIFCNCLGLNGNKIVEDKAKMENNIGILLKYSVDKLPKHPKLNQTISYNYFLEDYEVYCYPREKEIILGGTRIPVELNDNTSLSDTLIDFYKQNGLTYFGLNDIPVPEYIITHHRQFLRQLYHLELDITLLEAVMGIRPSRSEAIRLDYHEKDKLKIINAYGFGGAGVTLSWSCADRVLRLIQENYLKKEIADTNPEIIANLF